MSYNLSTIKEILLKLKELTDDETLSLIDFAPERHRDISLNIFQLLKNNVIVGSYFGAEKTENNISDFSVGTIKNIEIANKLLLYLKTTEEAGTQEPLSTLLVRIQKPLYDRLWNAKKLQ